MPRFDGTGPKGTGPMTGRGLGYCVVPIEGGSVDDRPTMPDSATYKTQQRPFGFLPYNFNLSKVGPYRFSFKGGRGRRAGAHGRFFGSGRGFGR